MTDPFVHGPHGRIPADDPRECLILRLFDALWVEYRADVVHVRSYEQVVRAAGATFVNDHIAFRTVASQEPYVGIGSLSRLFEALGYRAAGCYDFPDKQLSAVHLRHPRSEFPKLFVSELRLWELPAAARAAARPSLAGHRPLVDDETLAALAAGPEGEEADRLLESLRLVFRRPWAPPRRRDVETLHRSSQYGAWVLLHGYRVNHFTALINSQGPALPDIESTMTELQRAGVPIKGEIEGARGSKLRQSATAAADVEVAVIGDNGSEERMTWSYAYFELAERGLATDPETGAVARFEGFLGPQATQLFEMTRRS